MESQSETMYLFKSKILYQYDHKLTFSNLIISHAAEDLGEEQTHLDPIGL